MESIKNRIINIYDKALSSIDIKNDFNNYYETKALLGLSKASIQILQAIFKTIEQKNAYSSFILYRSLIEHYIKHMFIIYEYCKKKNNNIGKEYLIFTQANEIKSYGNALKLSFKLNNKNSDEIDYDDAIKKFSQEASQKSKTELSNYSKKFEFRSIIKTLKELENNFFNQNSDMFYPLVTEYAEWSSYVHAGATAIDQINQDKSSHLNQIKINTVMIMAFMISTTFKCLGKDIDKFNDYLLQINNIINNEMIKYNNYQERNK